MATNSKKQLTIHESEHIKFLEKYVENVHKVKDINNVKAENMYKYINEAINQKTNNEYSESWKKLKLYALSSYYKINEMEDKYEYMIKKSHEMGKKIENIEEKQEKTEKEKENELNIFELRILSEKYSKYNHLDEMYKYLLLSSLCRDQEPLRPQIYADVKYVTDPKEITDGEQNYIYISKKGKLGYFYINSDKVAENMNKKIKEGIIPKTKKRIRMAPEYLKIVKKTFDDYPRKYLFDFKIDNCEHKLLKMLQDMTNNKFNFQMARSVYITHKYLENTNMSYIQKRTLAENMRHTKHTQEKAYFKHGSTVTDKSLNDLKKETKEENDKMKDKEKKINDYIDIIDKIKKNKEGYKKQTYNMNFETDEKTKLLLSIQEIKAVEKKYDELLKEILLIINENQERLQPLYKVIDINKFKLDGKSYNDVAKQTELISILKKLGKIKTMKKIQQLNLMEKKYDYKAFNTEIKALIYEDDGEFEEDDSENTMTKKELADFRKKRKDIIYVANKRMKESIEKGDKKVKGTISSANMYKYDIVFNPEKKQYE